MSIPLLEYLFEEIYAGVWVCFPEHQLVIEPQAKTIRKKVQRKSKAFFFLLRLSKDVKLFSS